MPYHKPTPQPHRSEPQQAAPGLSSRALAVRSGAVLDLPPRTARLLLVAGLSYAIELLQPLNLRTRDFSDAVANTTGIAVGAAVGLGARLVYGYLRTELQAASIRHALVTVPAGTTIVQAGERVDRFWIVARGQVGLYLDGDTEWTALEQVGPGAMFGLLAEIEGTAQPFTVVALSEVQLYRLDYDTLVDAVGGPDQPLGVNLRYVAGELRQATTRVAALQQQLAGKDAS